MPLDCGVVLNGEAFTALQALSARHVAFSVTEACPLRCAHCMVNVGSVADPSRYMPLRHAVRYAADLPGLAARGVIRTSFTGGEPMLAPRQVRLLSAAAVRSGMACTIVTACHWATSDETARQRVREMPDIAQWHLSSDVFHQPFVDVGHVVRAAGAVLAEGRQAVVRTAIGVPRSEADTRLHQTLLRCLPPEVPIAVQRVAGRDLRVAGHDVAAVPRVDVPAWPCVPTGMLVRRDGSISPCCGDLVDRRHGHPFEYPRANIVGLVAAHQAWCSDPLLQLIRTVGFAPLLQWVRADLGGGRLAAWAPRHPCACCLELWRTPGLAAWLRRRAEEPLNRSKIERLSERVFGKTSATGAGPARAERPCRGRV